MGDRDLLRQVLSEDFKADIHFARVNMKPGKPTTCATVVYDGKKKLILGLPGNPARAHIFLSICHRKSYFNFDYMVRYRQPLQPIFMCCQLVEKWQAISDPILLF